MGQGAIRRGTRWVALLALIVGAGAATEIIRSPQAHAQSGVGYVAYVGASASISDSSIVEGALAFSTSGTAEGAITSTGAGTYAVGISPKDGHVYATEYGDGEFFGRAAISSANSYEPAAGATLAEYAGIDNEASLAGAAVSPDGQFAYTASEEGLYKVSTSNPPASATAMPYPPLIRPRAEVFIPQSLALSTDGSVAYIGGYEYNSAQSEAPSQPLLIAMATDGSGGSYLTGATTEQGAGSVNNLAVSPNGNTLWATLTDSDTPQVLQIPLPIPPPATASGPLPSGTQLSAEPSAIAVTPNGSTVYVGTRGGPGATMLFQLSTAASPVITPVPLPAAFGRARSSGIAGIAVTPDGGTLMVAANIENSQTALTSGLLLTGTIPANSPTGVADIPGPGEAAALEGTQYNSIAITADQAPVAHVTVSSGATTAGGAITFSTGSSTVAFGNITGFNWNVPGGSCNSLSAATITCTFANAGSFSAQVTETDDAGNSTVASALPGGGVVYTGSTASLVPAATATSPSVTVTVTSIPTTSSSSTTTTTTSSSTTAKATTTTVQPTTTTTTPKVTLKPKLTVNPGIGPPGFVTQVSGTDFPPNTPLTVTWSVGIGSAQVTTSATGTFSVQMLVMSEDQPGTRKAQVATFPSAKAPFLVVPGSLQPGGDDFSLLYNR